MRGIAFKLWIGLVSLVVFMLLLLWLFQVVFLKSFYLNQQISTVEKEGKYIAEAWDNLGEDELQDRIDRLFYSFKSNVDVFDSRGSLIYSSDYQMGMGRGQMPMGRHYGIQFDLGAFLDEVLKGNTIRMPSVHPRFRTSLMIIGIPVRAGGRVAGGMIISMPLAPIDETVETLKKQLIYITGILLAVTLILSYIMSRRLTRPILEIDRAAGKMATGDLSIRLVPGSRDEIGRLADTMNHLAEQLSRMDRLRKDLIANVSHELRTPLSIIKGYAETLRDVSGDDREKRDRQLGIIIEESDRLTGIVDDVLNLSQMQAGYLKLNVTSFNLGMVLNKVLKKYELLSEKYDIRIRSAASPELTVAADEGRIEQVLLNLVSNAFNHTPSGGTITVGAEDKGRTVVVEVSDTGPGIPGNDLEHIWERYYKSNKASGRKHIGTGLGLAIVKNILEAHNSGFGVKSEEGKGTVFWFELSQG